MNCPFCGSADVGLSRLHESRSFVMCNGCGAEADDTNTLPEASAADVWNRRVDDPLRTQLAAMQHRQVDDGKLWSFLRSVMAQGIDIRADHAEYELFSARMDDAAHERVEQLRAIMGASRE